VAFQPTELEPRTDETIELYVKRLLISDPSVFQAVPSFAVGDPSSRERPEVAERLPGGNARILDIGCGAGGLGLTRGSRPGWRLTGVERDAIRAARARAGGGYERILDGSLEDALPRLGAEGARFDAIVFADVLEHVEDPVAALRAARVLANANALLLAVVPNVGHLSVVRDLLLGRHDPVPAGLCDAGHLRWFSKTFLDEAIGEAGWTLAKIEGIPGAPPPDAGPFLELAKSWPEADLESLVTYQWIATARAGSLEAVKP
jgi:SAM-dependent methyltransferase